MRLARAVGFALFPAAAGGSVALVWVREGWGDRPFRQVHGIETAGGKGLVGLATIGVFLALFAGARRRLTVVEFAVAIVGIAAVVLTAALYDMPTDASYWEAAPWYWVSLGLAILWALAAAAVASGLVNRRRSRTGWWRSRTARDAAPPSTRVTIAYVAAATSAVLVLVGSFGPWRTAGGGFAASGFVDSGDGLWSALVAFMSLLALLAHWRLGNRRVLMEIFVAAVVLAVDAIWLLHDVNTADEYTSDWGLNVVAGAAVLLALSVLIQFVHQGTSLATLTRTHFDAAQRVPAADRDDEHPSPSDDLRPATET